MKDSIYQLSADDIILLHQKAVELGIPIIHDSFQLTIENAKLLRNIMPEGNVRTYLKTLLFASEYGMSPNMLKVIYDVS